MHFNPLYIGVKTTPWRAKITTPLEIKYWCEINCPKLTVRIPCIDFFFSVYFSLLANEIIWNVIRGLINNLPVAFRAAQVKYTQRYSPRWKTCNLLTDNYFTLATTLLYVNKHLPEDARKTVRYVCCPVYLYIYIAPNRLSLIFDESEWNNCFIIYTRSEFTDFAFRIFSIFFYFVFYLRSFGRLFFQKYIFLTILNFKNSFSNL